MEDVTLWLERLKEGDPRATEQIWRGYYQRLIELAHQRLLPAARRHVDDEDVAAGAFDSFFRGVTSGRFPKLDDRHDLWKILVTIAARKANLENKRALTLKRGAGKVVPQSILDQGAPADAPLDVQGKDPTPSTVASVIETFSHLMSQLPDARLKTITELKLEGYTNQEIAVQLGVVERTVERKLERIRRIWDENLES